MGYPFINLFVFGDTGLLSLVALRNKLFMRYTMFWNSEPLLLTDGMACSSQGGLIQK
jgi:hypothetical protein